MHREDKNICSETIINVKPVSIRLKIHGIGHPGADYLAESLVKGFGEGKASRAMRSQIDGSEMEELGGKNCAFVDTSARVVIIFNTEKVSKESIRERKETSSQSSIPVQYLRGLIRK